MNYGDLKTLTKNYLEVDETTFNSNIGQFVQMAEEDIYRQVQLPDLVKTETLSFVTGNQYLMLPEDFLSAYHLAVISSGQHTMLLSKDHSYIREVYPSVSVTGLPRFFAFHDESKFIVAPTPDQDYAAELNYFFYPPSLSDGDDTNTTWLSINAENAILYGTIIQGYIYLKGDQDVIASYKEQYMQAISELKVIAEGRDRKDAYRTPDNRLRT